jgi:hypothetical protein
MSVPTMEFNDCSSAISNTWLAEVAAPGGKATETATGG